MWAIRRAFIMKDETKIVPYKTGKGKNRFMFRLYVGKDDKTGESIRIKKTGFLTEQEALESLLALKLQVLKGEYEPVKNKRMLFSDLYSLWLKVYKNTVKESTYATTIRYFNDHILKELGNVFVDKLTVVKCQQAVNTWFIEAPRTYKRFMRYASNVLDYGVDIELIAKNPMKKVIRPKPPTNTAPFTDFYSKNELKTFLDCAMNYNYKSFMFFRLLAFSGMRKGECLALKWSDINFKNNTINITKSVTTGLNNRLYISDGKTISSIRLIDMDTQTMKYLKEWRTIQQRQMLQLGYNFLDKNNLIFANTNNGITSVSKPDQWNRAICNTYNLRRIKIHGFRHTHASLLFEAGRTIKEVSERLGHADTATTLNIYTHVTKDKKGETAEKFAEYVGF